MSVTAGSAPPDASPAARKPLPVMQRRHAEHIASLLNARNQLVVRYDADSILEAAADYLYKISAGDGVVACIRLRQLQWYQFEISHLATAPSMEGKGLARELLALAEERASSLGGLLLQCSIRGGNRRSEELFSKNGYRQVSLFAHPDSGNNVGVWQKVLLPAID